MKDSSIVVSLKESVVFNGIVRWNKIFVKWGSVRYHHQSQAMRYELKINLSFPLVSPNDETEN
jgi:hypothetical protein